jgi:hypothetical protein
MRRLSAATAELLPKGRERAEEVLSQNPARLVLTMPMYHCRGCPYGATFIRGKYVDNYLCDECLKKQKELMEKRPKTDEEEVK